MKSSALFVHALAGLLLSFSGCCSPTQPVIPEGVEVVPVVQHPLYPIEVGRFWVYRTYYYNYYNSGYNRGELRSIDSIPDKTYLFLCDTIIRHNGKIYRAAILNVDRDLPYWSDSKQVGFFHKLSPQPESTFFRKKELYYPIQKNDTFHVQRSLAPFETVQVYTHSVTCIGTQEDISVPAGNFKCYGFQYTTQSPDGHSVTSGDVQQYYAPKIGRVLAIVKSGGDMFSRTVLIRYGSLKDFPR
jgi:hypothetical protein